MRNSLKVFSILAVMAILTTCGEDRVGNARMYYENFREASMFRVSTPGVYVFRDEDSWNSFGDEYWIGDDNWGMTIPLPQVDFEKETVIGVFWDLRTHGCHNWVDCIDVVFFSAGYMRVYIDSLPDLGECASPVWPMQVIKVEMPYMQTEFTGYVPGRQ